MSNLRTIIWLLLGILLLAGGHFLVSSCGGARPQIVRRQTLAESRAKCASVIIERRGLPAARFVKTADWQLVEPFASAVDSRLVLRLLDELSFTHIDDAISDAELLKIGRTRADLGLAEPRVRVTLADGLSTERITFGAATPATNGVYAAVDGLESVFVVPDRVRAAVDLPIDAFRSREIFSVGPESVTGFDIKRGNGALLSFTREDDHWKVGSALAAEPKVKALLSSVLSASAKGFVWPVGATNESRSVTASLLAVYELDPESALTLTFKCVDGVDRQVSIGGEADEGRVYALVQNGGAIVTIDAAIRKLAAQDGVMFSDSRLFPYEPSAVRALTLADGETAYAVARGDDGVWRLDAPVSAPADAATVTEILERALALTALDVRSDGVKVSLSTNAEPVSVSRLSVLGKARLEDLRAKEILRVEPVGVRRLVRTPGGDGAKPTAVVFVRERRAWAVDAGGAPGSVSEKGVLDVLGALNPLSASRVVKLKPSAEEFAGYGLDTPFLTVAVDLDREESPRRNILIGRTTEGGRFVTVGASDAVFVVPDETVEKLSRPFVTE